MCRLLSVLLIGLALSGCGDKDDTSTPDTSTPDTASADGCESCLAGGGTWQPDGGGCTEDCSVADASCFRDECPGECSADECGYCFSRSECEIAGCTWNMEEEATWCS